MKAAPVTGMGCWIVIVTSIVIVSYCISHPAILLAKMVEVMGATRILVIIRKGHNLIWIDVCRE